MDRRSVLVGLASATLLAWHGPAFGGQRIAVIVNAKNPIKSLGIDEIEAIFKALKRSWSGGKRILPFNYPARDPLRVAFDRAALHMEPAAVARYWIDQRVRGGQHPPTQVPTSAMMRQVVSSLETAIGYVPTSELRSGVKVVAEV
jgi:ABC-type phosphate transport system substrate-binding protein